jgi:hypothetical protein
MKITPAIILGVSILMAAISHGLLVRSAPKALISGHIAGEVKVLKREPGGISNYNCNGFKAELYDAFVVIHVDKSRESTWTGNYILTIPWNQIESLTLLGEDAK